MMNENKKSNKKCLKVQLVRSLIGRLPVHKACATGLGLRRINQIVMVEDNPCNLGMVKKIAYLLKIEKVERA
jgi:large subunit ribosomal protein L30